jgi:hypothetical protein
MISFTPQLIYSWEKCLHYPHWIGGWVGPEPIWMLCRREKSLAPAGNWTSVIQAVVHRYADSCPSSSKQIWTQKRKGSKTYGLKILIWSMPIYKHMRLCTKEKCSQQTI